MKNEKYAVVSFTVPIEAYAELQDIYKEMKETLKEHLVWEFHNLDVTPIDLSSINVVNHIKIDKNGVMISHALSGMLIEWRYRTYGAGMIVGKEAPCSIGN